MSTVLLSNPQIQIYVHCTETVNRPWRTRHRILSTRETKRKIKALVMVVTEICCHFRIECLEFVDHANSTRKLLTSSENFIQWWEQSLPYSFCSEQTSPGTQKYSGQGSRDLCFKDLGRGRRWQTAHSTGDRDGKPPSQQGALSSLCSIAQVVFKALRIFFFKYLHTSTKIGQFPISGLCLQGQIKAKAGPKAEKQVVGLGTGCRAWLTRR